MTASVGGFQAWQKRTTANEAAVAADPVLCEVGTPPTPERSPSPGQTALRGPEAVRLRRRLGLLGLSPRIAWPHSISPDILEFLVSDGSGRTRSLPRTTSGGPAITLGSSADAIRWTIGDRREARRRALTREARDPEAPHRRAEYTLTLERDLRAFGLPSATSPTDAIPAHTARDQRTRSQDRDDEHGDESV